MIQWQKLLRDRELRIEYPLHVSAKRCDEFAEGRLRSVYSFIHLFFCVCVSGVCLFVF